MRPPVRVLVADDSRTAREAVAALLEAEGLDVVGRAADGEEAVSLAEALRPDAITLDVEMPRLDGLAAAARIMSVAPTRIIMVCAVDRAGAAELSFRAVQAGALEVVPKPTDGATRAWGRRLAETVRLMAEVPVVRRCAPAQRVAAAVRPPRALMAFGLVASTGGPQALARLLAVLPPRLPIPLLLAQHVGHGFTPGLVRWLASVSPLPVAQAVDGQRWASGALHVVPDGADLTLGPGGALRLRPSEPARPAPGDALLTSLAAVAGASGGGAVLTGMGDDGARGLLALRRAGGLTLAQDEASCAVFGMPRAALELGGVERLATPEEIGAAIAGA